MKPGNKKKATFKLAVSILVVMTVLLMPFGAMAETGDTGKDNVVIVFAIDYNEYSVNGELLTMDVSPTIIESRTLLPIRYAAEPLGADIGWDPNDRKASVSLEGTDIELWIGESNSLVNGKIVSIDPDNFNVKPIIINGRTMLPLRFVAETLGCEVQWDPETKRVAIIKMAPSSDKINIPDILKNPDFINDIINNIGKPIEIKLPGKNVIPDKKIPDITVPDTNKIPDIQWQIPSLPGLVSEYDILKVNDTSYYENYYGTLLTADTGILKTPAKTYSWGVTNNKPMSLQYFAFYLKPGGKYENFSASFFLDSSAKADLPMTIRKDNKQGIVLKSLTLKPGETLEDINLDIVGIDKLYFESELRINHGSVEKIVVGEPIFYKAKK